MSETHRLLRTGDCDTLRFAFVMFPASCEDSFSLSVASDGLEHAWEHFTICIEEFVSYCVWVSWKKEQVWGWKTFGSTRTKAAKTAEEGGWHIFHSLHGCQQWWFSGGRKKLSRGGDLHGDEERERENEKERWEGEQALALVSIYGLFIYARLSGFLPLTPAEDPHRMGDVPHRQKSMSPSHSRDAVSCIRRASEQTFVSQLYPFSVNLLTWLFTVKTQTDRAVSWNHSQSPKICFSSTAVPQHCSKNSLLLILSRTQYVFTHLW